jgi:hypothetical protein
MARVLLTVLIGLSIVLLLGLEKDEQTKEVPKSVPDFEVHGIDFTECACTAYACPCRSNGHPTHGSCDAADFAYIKQGHFGNVKMDGFKAVIVGDLIDKDSAHTHGTVYFDEKTTPEQQDAFKQMVGFMFAWHPPKIDQAKVVPIEFSESSDHNVYTLTIPGILEEKGVMKRDADGKPLHTVPAMDLWGNKITYVDNVVFKYHDKGVGEWDLSGHQANVKEINTTKTMWEQKQMLVQHGDMSGTWTAEQRKMIEAMGMKSD